MGQWWRNLVAWLGQPWACRRAHHDFPQPLPDCDKYWMVDGAGQLTIWEPHQEKDKEGQWQSKTGVTQVTLARVPWLIRTLAVKAKRGEVISMPPPTEPPPGA